jgi:replication factor C small subunit
MQPREYFAWVEKYRPQTLGDCILPKSVKDTLAGVLSQKDTTNLLIGGRAGTGKTTVAKALLREIDCDAMIINASDENGIDVVRHKIKDYASSMSLDGKRKYVVLDEADNLTGPMQQALRAFIEEFAGSCGFILTANFPSRIIEPLHSRCSFVDFKIPVAERPTLAAAFAKRAIEILTAENITFNRQVVLGTVQLYFPDFRRVLNELQRFSATGELSEAILTQLSDKDVTDLFKAVKGKDYTDIRKWVAAHEDMDETQFYSMMREQIHTRAEASCLAELIVSMADYNYRSAFAADKQLNVLACLVELMHGGTFK